MALVNLKDVIDEEALVRAATDLLVPSLEAALTKTVKALPDALAGLTITITVSRKPEA